MPIAYGDTLIVSAQSAGIVALRPRLRPGGWVVEKAWETAAVEMYISHPVVIGDTLYGFSRRNSGQLFALDARDGRVLWLGSPRFATNVAPANAGDGGARVTRAVDGPPLCHLPTYRVRSCDSLFYIVVVMADRDFLGEFEHVVLLALLRLVDNAYGVSVRQEIDQRTGRDVSIGAIYATLDRLERKGYVTSRLGDPTPERGGRSKRFFRVTARGRTAVNRTHDALHRMTEGLSLVRRFV
jgi:DNA-binding PadR family transcriptional regulator